MIDNSLDRAPVAKSLIEGLRRCAICKVEKSRSDFYQSPSGQITSYCHPCDAARGKTKRNARTPEQRKQEADYKHKWNLENPKGCRTGVEQRKIAAKEKYASAPDRRKAYYKKYYRENEAKVRAVQIRIRLGVTAEQYDFMFRSQDGLCAICHKPESRTVGKTGTLRRLSVDHDHLCCKGLRSCGKCIRGLLCSSCNFAIGHLADDEARIMDALTYVRKWKR